MKAQLNDLKKSTTGSITNFITIRAKTSPGLNDGLIYPGNEYPLGTSVRVVREAVSKMAPPRGTIKALVVLVQFTDKKMTQTKEHYQDLLFSTGVLPNGSLREYYREASNSMVDILGDVVGPYTLPLTMAAYANGQNAMGSTYPNGRTMAFDAVKAAVPDVNYSQYDVNGDGYVDALIIVHAGIGAEVTGNASDIWSHKWVLPDAFISPSGTKVYAYDTVPEDAKTGVCCHEFGHLMFGWPDMYDADYTSAGIGNWCLMAGGSWNGNGEIPAHPSAWCKVNQGWVSEVTPNSNGTVSLDAVETGHTIYCLWKDGTPGSEYFLVENRQKVLFDRTLPGSGLLIYHVDDTIVSNDDENHPKVALVQADNRNDLKTGANRGDAGDPYPGSSNNLNFGSSTSPDSKSYGNVASGVALTGISPSGATITASIVINGDEHIQSQAPPSFFAGIMIFIKKILGMAS